MELKLFVPILLGFLISFISLPIWINKAKRIGLVGKDMNKKSSETVAEAGGICVVLGFILGVLSYVALKTFYFESKDNVIQILAIISTMLIISFIGFADDILGWKIGLTKKVRLFLLLIASFPLIVTNAGESVIFGANIGLIYPLLIIPLGIIGATSTFNFLAGYNGLESSQGILILGSLSLIAYFTGNKWLSIIGLVMVACLVAFYIFNKYPAKIFPGDVLTYPTGALIAILAIFGNMEKIALFFFIPYIVETILKVRGRLKKESFAKVDENGNLKMPYEKVYGLEHLAILILSKLGKKVTEKGVVYLINFFQIVIIAIGFVIFRKEIFVI